MQWLSPLTAPPDQALASQAPDPPPSPAAKGNSAALIGGVAAGAVLVAVLLGVLVVRGWRRRHRRRQAAQAAAGEDREGEQLEGALHIPTIRADKPAKAAAAMKALRAPVALVATPWRPAE